MSAEKYRRKFKRFGGEYVPDIIEYLSDYLKEDPTTTISVGVDSMQRRKRTTYAITVMLYNSDIKNGAHVVFMRESHPKIRDHYDRLGKESFYAQEVGLWIHEELTKLGFKRQDLTPESMKFYKFHIEKCDGKLKHLAIHDQGKYINTISLSDYDKNTEFMMVDLHLDYNPFEGNDTGRGSKNKSNVSYHAYVPWLRGMNFRVFCKNDAHAATSAADLLLQS